MTFWYQLKIEKNDCKYGLRKVNCIEVSVLIQHTKTQSVIAKCDLKDYSWPLFGKVVFFIMTEDITMWNYYVILYNCMELPAVTLSQILPFGTSQQFDLITN